MRHVWIALIVLLASRAASAQAPTPPADVRYRVDLILFLDKYGDETPVAIAPLNTEALIELDDTAALAAEGVERLAETDSALAREYQQLRRSKRYQPLISLSWAQKNPPSERGRGLRLRWGPPLSAGDSMRYTVDGSVSLLLGRYLHLDVDLAYTRLAADGRLLGVALRERRRMKRDELNYLDSPKLGILAKITRLKD